MSMESQSTEAPLRICPRCSAATRTDSETCPACGRRYRRRYWIWALGAAIVVLAFGAGFGIRALVNGGGDSGVDAITNAQGNSVAAGSSREQLDQSLHGAQPSSIQHVSKGGTCLTYPSKEAPDFSWIFCFRDDALYLKTQVKS
jgi:hypothetical protein